MPRANTRKVPGSNIHALARHVTSIQECRRLFGSNWSLKIVNGVVISARHHQLLNNHRKSWLITGKYQVQRQQITKELNIRSVKEYAHAEATPVMSPYESRNMPLPPCTTPDSSC